jgi:hypothetical protein
MKKLRHIGALAAACALAVPGTAAAQTTEVVTEADVTRQAENTPPTDNWVLYTRTATSLGEFVDGPGTPPAGTGSLHLVTPTGADKVFLFNYDHVGTPLADVDHLAYSTYRESGTGNQLPAINIQVDYNGDAEGGFTTLVYEPVYNNATQPIVEDQWQDWIASGSGRWWSTRPINGQCAGATTLCFRTWDQIQQNNPDAVITGGFGVNQGSGNPALDANVDALEINSLTYDFERAPASKDECKNGGWETFTSPAFKNQGDCVSFVASQQA